MEFGILGIECQKPHHVGLGGCAVAFQKRRAVARRVHDRLPLVGVIVGQVEHQIVVDVQKAGDVFGAFDISAEPVDCVRDPAEQWLRVWHRYCC